MANHANVEAVLDRTSIPPGGSATLALVFKIDPGWHTYWINPGDAGAPPKVKWTLPAGVTVSELQFPIPHRKTGDGLTTFIYENEAVLLANVTVSADVKSDIDLAGTVKSVVCSDECILEEQSVALRVPIGPGVAANADRFAKWRATQPKRQSPLTTVKADVDSTGKGGKIAVPFDGHLHAVDLIPPKTRVMKFDSPTTLQAEGPAASIFSKFRVLSDPPPQFSGVGLLVLKDAAGTMTGEEVQIEFSFPKP